MKEVTDWLGKLGMSEYAQRFADNDIDIDVLNELTDQDFDRLGVSLGHRRRMLRAIRELSASPIAAVTERQTSAPTAPEQAPKDTAERRQVTVMFSDLVGSGLVVVGDLIGSGEAQERGIVGETPNLVARLQWDRRCSMRSSDIPSQWSPARVYPQSYTSNSPLATRATVTGMSITWAGRFPPLNASRHRPVQ